MSDAGSRAPGSGDTPRDDRGESRGDFQASVARLERAVNDLVTTTRAQVSDRTTTFLDETTQRLERELDRRQDRADRGARSWGRGDRTSLGDVGQRDPLYDPDDRDERYPGMTRRLYRDPGREKIGGVCAGIARYYGMEPWVVRCITVTALLFFPTIVFPAYWIAYFVLDKPPGPGGESARSRRRGGRRHCKRGNRESRDDYRSPAPELGPRFSPRYSLRNAQADLREVELRLRRMETHVTSGQYELQRELNKIDGGADARPA